MYFIDNATAAPTRPAAGAAGTPGYFTNGNPATGVRPTILDQAWLNAVQQDLTAVIVAGGLTPTKGVDSQLLAAIQAIGAVSAAPRLLAASTVLTQGGAYLLNTTSGSFNVTLPVAPAQPCYLTFIDAKLTWKANPPTLLLGGASLFNPVTGAVIPGDLTLNVKGLTWTMFWDGTYWSAC
jgi:hypothetical protein